MTFNMEMTNQPQEELVKDVPKKNNNNLFSFEGRIRRRTYWIISLIYGFFMDGFPE